MAARIMAPLVLCLCIGLSILSCSKTNSPKEALTVSSLKINNGEISGWTVQRSGVFYSAENWRNGSPVDGYADRYTVDPGLTFSAVLDEAMSGPTGASVNMYVIDYANAASSRVMFDYTKTHRQEYSSSPDPLTPNYPDSVAVGENSHDGISVCAHFKQFYLELQYTGYADYSQSKTDALSFLLWFETKINGD
jgi:hypothetical protein